MLIFSAIVPHAAILLPSVGKENLKKLPKTLQALHNLKTDLEAAKPDAIIVISSHAGDKEHFSLYINNEYESDFEKLGDFATKIKFDADMEMLAVLRKAIRLKNFPLAVRSDKKLNYDLMLPLFYINGGLKTKIIPLETASLPLKNHFDFGAALKEIIVQRGAVETPSGFHCPPSEKRVAIIAAGNLSHALATDAPGGFSPAGKEFDEKLREFIAAKNAAGLVLYDENKLKEAKECCSHQIATLFGAMQQIDYTPQIYSYESPFGVGFLVANLKL